MRWIVAVGMAGLALLASGSVSRSDASSAPNRVEVTGPGGPLLGIVWKRRGGELVRVDRSSLRPLPGRRITIRSWPVWSFSPNGSRLVIWDERVVGVSLGPWLRLLSARTLRTLGWLPLKSKNAGQIAWLTPGRLLAIEHAEDSFDVVRMDVPARREVGRRTVPGWVITAERAGKSLILLVATPREIAAARLVVANAEGIIRSVTLERIHAGIRYPPEPDESGSSDPSRFIGQRRQPGLAVDAIGARAYVVDPGGVVAEVALDDLGVQYHDLAEPRSLLGRLTDWLEPDAHAKGALHGPARHARWLGGGLIAVSGEDESSFVDARGGLQVRSRAAGLKLIDTRTWQVRTLDEGANRFLLVGGDVLVTGWSSDLNSGKAVGMGLAGYALGGEKRFQLFGGRPAWVVYASRGRAYVDVQNQEEVASGGPLWVVELASGRVVGKLRHRVPSLLVEK